MSSFKNLSADLLALEDQLVNLDVQLKDHAVDLTQLEVALARTTNLISTTESIVNVNTSAIARHADEAQRLIQDLNTEIIDIKTRLSSTQAYDLLIQTNQLNINNIIDQLAQIETLVNQHSNLDLQGLTTDLANVDNRVVELETNLTTTDTAHDAQQVIIDQSVQDLIDLEARIDNVEAAYQAINLRLTTVENSGGYDPTQLAAIKHDLANLKTQHANDKKTTLSLILQNYNNIKQNTTAIKHNELAIEATSTPDDYDQRIMQNYTSARQNAIKLEGQTFFNKEVDQKLDSLLIRIDALENGVVVPPTPPSGDPIDNTTLAALVAKVQQLEVKVKYLEENPVGLSTLEF